MNKEIIFKALNDKERVLLVVKNKETVFMDFKNEGILSKVPCPVSWGCRIH